VISLQLCPDLLLSIHGKTDFTINAAVRHREMPVVAFRDDESTAVDDATAWKVLTVQANVHDAIR
jgi:hypothetical protein